ncbi:hypothetical protein ACWDBD_21715 [Streptomyces sp. NPDC001118]
MKTAIEHVCGHIHTADLLGTNAHGERDRKAEWLATQLCPACARTQRDEDHQRQAEEAAHTAAANDWPTLTGSEKQISWADQIRVAAIEEMTKRLHSRLTADVAEKALAYWTRAALRQTDAAWWIDNRARILPSINSLTLTADERAALSQMTGAGK